MKKVLFFVAFCVTLLAGQVQAKKVIVRDDMFEFELNTSTKKAVLTDYFKGSSTGTVTIPDEVLYSGDGNSYKVVKIGETAFLSSKMKAVNFPSGLTTIGKEAFYNCPNLYKDKVMTIPEGVTTIDTLAFAFLKASEIRIPSTCKTIRLQAFADVTARTVRFAAPKDGLTIGNMCFAMSDIETIAFPMGMTKLGESAFLDCLKLKSISFPGSLSKVPSCCCYNCPALTTVSFQEGVKTIGWGAFSQCNISAVSFPGTLKVIEYQAFEYNHISSLVLSNGVTDIGSWAFQYNEEMTGVYIGPYVSNIGKEAFWGCTKLMGVNSRNLTPPKLGEKCFSKESLEYATLYLQDAAVNEYRLTPGWKDFKWFDRAGVNDVCADNSEAAEYYNLSGIRVADTELHPGVYIKRTPGGAEKILIK
ncbi:MAG: leucine-rich repeat domain-containing protein [Muribaculaceae bacterium]|nr:leucine-rich repeat domain-containing protein [Muribaculaceae bacterium]